MQGNYAFEYAVVVPVYRGRQTLLPLVQRLFAFFEARRLNCQLIFVDDCGPDNSWQTLLEIKRLWPTTVTLVKLARNAGQHAATLCGFTFAQSRYLLTLDEDLQHPPEEIEKLIATRQAGNYQLVYGIYATPGHNRLRNLASGCFNRFITAAVPNLCPGFTSFRLIETNMAKQAANLQVPYPFVDGLLARLNAPTGGCPINHQPETTARNSAYNWRKLAKHAWGIVAGFTNVPQITLVACALLLLFLWQLQMYLPASIVVVGGGATGTLGAACLFMLPGKHAKTLQTICRVEEVV
ncbi:glycosyltransferase [Sphingobacteriales bacterium UPWRP_1]|nr:hypothetical protein BVG80_02585 [Sphingobacteriales bacterium TSM_CSM]PSJ75244.1 glycosyltransferase [Sphingobacteriales bacterium UPWRP_1]